MFAASWAEDQASQWRHYRGGRTQPIRLMMLADYSEEKLPWTNSNDTEPMWVGNIFAWGSDKAGVGHNPKSDPQYDDRLTSHRRYELPGAVWADLEYSAAEPFDIDIPVTKAGTYYAFLDGFTYLDMGSYQFSVTIDGASTRVGVSRGQVEVADFKSGQIAQVLPGQVAAVRVGAVDERLLVRDRGFGLAPTAYVCVSIDHRTLDGMDAGALLAEMKRSLENYPLA